MRSVDFLVLGGGIAGLRAALDLGRSGRVLVVTKESLGESNTAYAQGGIAVALGGGEDVELHIEDTVAAGDGLVDVAAAEVLVREGPQRVEELLAWGTAFDRYEGGAHAGELMLTREGAHSLPRILHADGDATGRVIARSLLGLVRGNKEIELLEWSTGIDLLLAEGRVIGATLIDREGALIEVRARAVLLATGGAGQVYSDTTNPAVATGDGVAMAWRAGAELMDMEFYQFHPTAFAMRGAPRFLVSEAVRGEGARLVNAAGERFMERYDGRLELAPRDVVARAIAAEARSGAVFLDMRHAGARLDLKKRFPGISAFLAGYGLELGRDLIPVGPAAHYMMGGVRTDVWGRTSLRGLYAAGEAACTGVHGANRLASNSLLEGLVFGANAAEAMRNEAAPNAETGAAATIFRATETNSGQHSHNPGVSPWVDRLRSLMWHDAGLLRDAAGLEHAIRELEAMRTELPAGLTRAAIEARNLHAVADAMARAALARTESRGSHYRTDFPRKWPLARHSVVRSSTVDFEIAL